MTIILPENDHHPSGTIEYDWVKVVNQIGGLGYSYATSKVYGPEGQPEKREALRQVLYQTLLTYLNSVPVNGDELMIDGKPIGNGVGDGFALLQKHRMAGMQTPTHQWNMTDGLMVPVLHLMPDILEGIKQGNQTCIELHNSLIDYLQLFFAEIESRRAMRRLKAAVPLIIRTEGGASCRIRFIPPVLGETPTWDTARVRCWHCLLFGRIIIVRLLMCHIGTPIITTTNLLKDSVIPRDGARMG